MLIPGGVNIKLHGLHEFRKKPPTFMDEINCDNYICIIYNVFHIGIINDTDL